MPDDSSCVPPQVLVCPPAGCLAAGTCDLSRYSLMADLTGGCGINTDTAAVGTSFKLTFQVYDDLQVGWPQSQSPNLQPTK